MKTREPSLIAGGAEASDGVGLWAAGYCGGHSASGDDTGDAMAANAADLTKTAVKSESCFSEVSATMSSKMQPARKAS
jgi:hypothetical protein